MWEKGLVGMSQLNAVSCARRATCPNYPVAQELSSLRTTLIRALVIVLAGLLVYWPALDGDWLWDDVLYVTGNPLLHDPNRVWKAWFVPGSFMEYYPLEETVQWIQWKLWGEVTFGYHLTNVLLHLINALLVWRLLGKFGLRWAWLGGLIFVLHPMNVESVAYISELKNTLSLPFFLLALCAYFDFEEHQRPRDYFLALALFLIAMLCKITMMTFPFVILLYAWRKRGLLNRNDFLHAAPFLMISLILGATTLWAGQRFEQLYPSHPAALPSGDFLSRLALIGQVISCYFIHTVWPIQPLPMYPRWNTEPLSLFSFVPWLVWIAAIYALWRARATWGRYALLGLGFFVLMLLPFSGAVIASYMNFTWVMDHFLYIPMIGLIGLTIASLEQIRAWLPPRVRPVLVAMLTVVMFLLATRSQDYAAVWTDRASLWTYTLERNPQAWLAHYNLANDLRSRGRYDEAIDHYRQAIALNPAYDWAHNNLALALGNFPDRLPEAISEFRLALQLRPNSAEAHNNLATALLQLPDHEPEAISEYQAALQARPDFIEAKYNLSLLLAKTGRVTEAKVLLQEIMRQHPGFAPAQTTLDKLPSNQPSP